MKLSTVDTLASILSGIKLNKIKDKDVKDTLINDYLYLRRFVKKSSDDIKEIREKFQSDWEDEMGAVESQREENRKNKTNEPIVGHDEYLDAERDANKAIENILKEEVDVQIKSVKMSDFVAFCSDDEITLEQLAFLEENGVVQ